MQHTKLASVGDILGIAPVACLLATGLFFGSCVQAPPQIADRYRTPGRFASSPSDRPGIGTRWGENRPSRVTIVPFERADPERPCGAAAIYYNDLQGIRAMAGGVVEQGQWSVLPIPLTNLVQLGLKDQSGRFLPGLIVGDRWFVVGEEGRRYSIVVRNRSDWRLEAVLSVDGLDVLDGGPASFTKRGYLLKPHSQITIDGFRQSTETVAAFRFGPVRESYANEKYHRTRNVGVIGLALFNEAAPAMPSPFEIAKRLSANPFPARFTTRP